MTPKTHYVTGSATIALTGDGRLALFQHAPPWEVVLRGKDDPEKTLRDLAEMPPRGHTLGLLERDGDDLRGTCVRCGRDLTLTATKPDHYTLSGWGMTSCMRSMSPIEKPPAPLPEPYNLLEVVLGEIEEVNFYTALPELAKARGHTLGELTFRDLAESRTAIFWFSGECTTCGRRLLLIAPEPPSTRYLLAGEAVTPCWLPLP